MRCETNRPSGPMDSQSSAPEDGKNNYPKRVELTGIINKPLLLHLVGCIYFIYIYIYISLYFLRLANQSQFNPYTESL